MPEDYQAILSDLGVNTDTTSEQATAPTQPADASTPAPETNTNSNSENASAEPSTADSTTASDSTVEDKDLHSANNAFAQLRSENGKYKKIIQQLMRGAGFNGKEEDFINQLTEASYANEAKHNQVSPEVLKRMDNLETQNRTLIEAQNRQIFATNLQKLQETFKLSDNDLKEFITLAAEESIDLTIPGTNFVTLYQGLFFDKIKDKLIEDERQKWIAQNNKSNNATNPDGKSGKKDPEPTDVNTMAEFDRLLQSLPKDKK